MSFGSCCILDGSRYSLMNAKSVEVKGEELGLLVNFEVTQTFYHEESSPKEVSYIFPNDLKMCIYDTTFVVGKEIIKPKLEAKEEAKKTYEEAVKSGHTAVYGSNIKNGLTKFKLGNVPPNTDCKVILKVAFTANVTKQNSFFIKFPLDVCTPNGSLGCLDVISSQFQFQLQCDKKKIKYVKSNVRNIQYDKSTKQITIQDRVDNSNNEHSIILNFETKENIQSSVLVGETINDYDNCVITISPNLEDKRSRSTIEFIFLIDCSGSMSGSSIRKAAECLDLFIRSLPVNSYFNIVRFGSSYEKLFETSVQYNEANIKKALNLAANLRANLGGTRIYEPLKNIYKQTNKFGQRQVFIMTDGEVWDTSEVIELVSNHSKENRCFTIGIGRGCDAGLVEGMANSSGGKCDFVQEGDSISEKVIPQLESSLYGILSSTEIHIEGEENDAFQVSPYPLPTLTSKGCCLVYLRSKKKGDKNKFEDKNFLITVNQDNETVDIPVEENIKAKKIEEDKFGCSNGRNIGKSILPLFAFQQLQKYEKKEDISEDEKKNAIELSISSGVLCKYTGYVGVSKEPLAQSNEEDYSDNCRCCRRAATKRCCRKADSDSSDSDSDKVKKCCRKAAPKKCCRKAFVPKMCCENDDSDSSDSDKAKGCCRNDFDFSDFSDSSDSDKAKGCCRNDFDFSDFSDSSDSDKAKKCCRKADFDFSDSSDSDSDKAKKCCRKAAPKRCCRKADSDSSDSDKAKKCCRKAAPKKCCRKAFVPKMSCKKADSDSSDSDKAKKCCRRAATKGCCRKADSDKANECLKSDSSVKKHYDLMTLLHSQNFTGYWENLSEINEMLGLNVSKINGVDVTDKKIANKCVATILALAALHVKSMDQKNLWTMIEIKAIDWLKITLPNADINQLIKDIESII